MRRSYPTPETAGSCAGRATKAVISGQSVSLLTDYGLLDEFAGVLHAVLARIAPAARVIDISHAVPACDVRAGALMLARAVPYLPPGVCVGVVDPGVGGSRRAVALRAVDGRLFVGPDNGLLWPAVALCGGPSEAVEISRSPVRLEPVSATFHGRDLFAPVAAALANGTPLDQLGERLDPALLVRLERPSPLIAGGVLRAEVVAVDRFGNVALGAGREHLTGLGVGLGDRLVVGAAGELRPARLRETFAEAADGGLVAYVDAAGQLALAVYGASAADRLGVGLHASVELHRAPARGGG